MKAKKFLWKILKCKIKLTLAMLVVVLFFSRCYVCHGWLFCPGIKTSELLFAFPGIKGEFGYEEVVWRDGTVRRRFAFGPLGEMDTNIGSPAVVAVYTSLITYILARSVASRVRTRSEPRLVEFVLYVTALLIYVDMGFTVGSLLGRYGSFDPLFPESPSSDLVRSAERIQPFGTVRGWPNGSASLPSSAFISED